MRGNTNGTCLKSFSKPPTFRFFRDFQLFQHTAKLAKLRQIWVNIGKKGHFSIEKSEDSNARIFEKMGTNERTYERR